MKMIHVVLSNILFFAQIRIMLSLFDLSPLVKLV